MDSKKSDICVFCHYARMKKDICGIYCAGAFWKKPDGTCDHFEDYKEHRKKRKNFQNSTFKWSAIKKL